jgi:WD40 repeat protein
MHIIRSENQREFNLLAVGPNGLVAAATRGGTWDIEIWDASTGERRFVHRNPDLDGGLSGLVLHPDGQTLVFGCSRMLGALDVATGAVTPGLLECAGCVQIALSPDGTRLLVIERREEEHLRWSYVLACYELGAGLALTRQWGIRTGEWADFQPRFSADGTRIAVLVNWELQIRSARTGNATRAQPDPEGGAGDVAFSADGSVLIVGNDSPKVQLFDAATGSALGALLHPGKSFVTKIAVHPRGPVACARKDGSVSFWDLATRERTRTFSWRAGKLVSLAFAPDGALAAAGTYDGKIVVWDVDL